MNRLTKSERIKKGMRESFNNVNSKIANRVCYGYRKQEDGSLVIDENEAEIVRFIFNRYLNGNSLGKISKELEEKDVLSPTGKIKWNKEAISKLISNEKHIGQVMLQKTFSTLGIQPLNDGEHNKYLIKNHHIAIIEIDKFNLAQELKNSRSKGAKQEQLVFIC